MRIMKMQYSSMVFKSNINITIINVFRWNCDQLSQRLLQLKPNFTEWKKLYQGELFFISLGRINEYEEDLRIVHRRDLLTKILFKILNITKQAFYTKCEVRNHH